MLKVVHTEQRYGISLNCSKGSKTPSTPFQHGDALSHWDRDIRKHDETFSGWFTLLQRTWLEMEFHLDVIRATNGAQIEVH